MGALHHSYYWRFKKAKLSQIKLRKKSPDFLWSSDFLFYTGSPELLSVSPLQFFHPSLRHFVVPWSPSLSVSPSSSPLADSYTLYLPKHQMIILNINHNLPLFLNVPGKNLFGQIVE